MPNKTIPTNASVPAFIAALPDEARRKDCKALVTIFKKATGQKPVIWGDRIIGFGKHSYPLANGKQGEICKASFAPRASTFALYLADFPGRSALLENLGKHKFSGGCLHIPTLTLVNSAILEEIVRKAYLHNLQTG